MIIQIHKAIYPSSPRPGWCASILLRTTGHSCCSNLGSAICQHGSIGTTMISQPCLRLDWILRLLPHIHAFMEYSTWSPERGAVMQWCTAVTPVLRSPKVASLSIRATEFQVQHHPHLARRHHMTGRKCQCFRTRIRPMSLLFLAPFGFTDYAFAGGVGGCCRSSE
ncbi:hypothetical protein BDW75DRAFT_171240 [Aspergillus navahoensis]